MVLHHVCSEFTVGEARLARVDFTHIWICLRGGVFDGRDDWIRTSDLTHPKGALYQAEPRPDGTLTSVHEAGVEAGSTAVCLANNEFSLIGDAGLRNSGC